MATEPSPAGLKAVEEPSDGETEDKFEATRAHLFASPESPTRSRLEEGMKNGKLSQGFEDLLKALFGQEESLASLLGFEDHSGKCFVLYNNGVLHILAVTPAEKKTFREDGVKLSELENAQNKIILYLDARLPVKEELAVRFKRIAKESGISTRRATVI